MLYSWFYCNKMKLLQDTLSICRKNILYKPPRLVSMCRVLGHSNRILSNNVEVVRNVYDLHLTGNRRGHIGAVDETGIDFAQLHLFYHSLHIRFPRDKICLDSALIAWTITRRFRHVIQHLQAVLTRRNTG